LLLNGQAIGRETVKLAWPFEDPQGRRFECIGYAGRRYGPTLVWQVSRPQADG